jgi:hypothetical protein
MVRQDLLHHLFSFSVIVHPEFERTHHLFQGLGGIVVLRPWKGMAQNQASQLGRLLKGL